MKRMRRIAARRSLCLFLAACLAFCLLAGCSAREGSAAAPIETESVQNPSSLPGETIPPVSAPETAKPEEQEEPVAEAPLQPGKILALEDPQRPQFPEEGPALAEENEQERWEAVLASGEIARLDAGGMNESEAPLSPESAKAILDILRGAKPALYEALENPPTGGALAVYAYAADDSRLFMASYNGAWLSVQFGAENVWYVFNGENSGLERLEEYIG